MLREAAFPGSSSYLGTQPGHLSTLKERAMDRTTCPIQFGATGCTDMTRAASSDAALADLLATIAAAAIVLVLQASKQEVKQAPFEQGMRNTVLTILVSIFLSAFC